MVLISRLLSRVVGPACLLFALSALLAPLMSQPSLRGQLAATQLAAERLGPTVSLILPAILFASALWLPLARSCTSRGRSLAGPLAAAGGVAWLSFAPFVVGVIALLVFGVWLRLVPASGWGSAAHLILPTLTIGIGLVGLLAYTTYLRVVAHEAAAAEAHTGEATSGSWLQLADDWLDTLSRHAGMLLGAVIVAEALFAVPGIGRLLVDAIAFRDNAVIAAASFTLVAISVALTGLFGVGAALTGWLLDRRRPSPASPTPETAPAVAAATSRRLPVPALAALAVGGLLLAGLLVSSLLPGADPIAQQIGARLAPPGTAGHPLGTDELGRDVLARITAGIRTSLVVAGSATLAAASVGLIFGLLAAAHRIFDVLVSFAVDSVLAVPALVFALAALALTGPGLQTVIGVTALVLAPMLARFTREAVLAVWAGGRRRLWPSIGALALALLFGLGAGLVFEATLSFLGFGVQPPTPSLGGMIGAGRAYAVMAPWTSLYASIYLTLLTASVLLLGYGALGLLRPRSAVAGSETAERPTEPAAASA